MAWAQDQLFNASISLNNMGGSIGYVADATARVALETSFIENGVTNIPNGIFICQLDDGSLWRWYAPTSTWTQVVTGGTPISGSGSAGSVAYWTSASVLAATPLTYAASVFTFPGNIKIPYNRGILDQGSNFIVGVGDVLPPFTNTVMLGSTALPTYIRGTNCVIACSESPGTGDLVLDVDIGTEFSVLNQVTTGGRAFRVRDRAGSPATYLECLISTTLGNKGLTFSNGMELYMGSGVIHGVGAATTAGDAPQLEQLAGRQMVRI